MSTLTLLSPQASLRRPTAQEAPGLSSLIESEAREGQMLPRPASQIRASLDDWIVAENGGRVVGGCSLVDLGDGVLEIRSLVVQASERGTGLGTRLVEGVIELARHRGAKSVLTLTRRVAFFERLGFGLVVRESIAAKMERDCQGCPWHTTCDETALLIHLSEKNH